MVRGAYRRIHWRRARGGVLAEMGKQGTNYRVQLQQKRI